MVPKEILQPHNIKLTLIVQLHFSKNQPNLILHLPFMAKRNGPIPSYGLTPAYDTTNFTAPATSSVVTLYKLKFFLFIFLVEKSSILLFSFLFLYPTTIPPLLFYIFIPTPSLPLTNSSDSTPFSFHPSWN